MRTRRHRPQLSVIARAGIASDPTSVGTPGTILLTREEVSVWLGWRTYPFQWDLRNREVPFPPPTMTDPNVQTTGRPKSGNTRRPSRAKHRMTEADRRQRDALIAQRVAQGWQWKAVASEAGMSERNARERLAVWREHHAGILSKDGARTLEHLVEAQFASVGDFEAMALTADNDSARLGAKRSAVETREKCIRVLRELGMLPRSMRGVRDMLEARALGELLWGTFDEAKERDLSVAEAEELFRARLGQYLGDPQG